MALEKAFEIGPFAAQIIKHDSLGHLCGYLGLPEHHPRWGENYDDMPGDVHGGWTYCADSAPLSEPDGRWWIGFDCAHLGDLVPGGGAPRPDDVYRDAEFVEAELRRVAGAFELATPH